jgi:tetratricopeptide (TPR) repeat protein
MGWADRQLQAELAANLPMQALAHAEALLQVEAPPQGWQPLAENLLYDHHDRLEALGRLGECSTLLRLIEAWLLRMPTAEQDGAEWQRERSVIQNQLGDLLQAQGDLAGAQQRYEASLRISDALATRDPDNAGWQRDLSVSFEKLGDLLQAQGDLAGAQQRYEASLRIRDALATRDPDNAGWQRDLAVSWIKLGTVREQQGDVHAAQTYWQQAQRVLQMLVQRAPDHPRFRQDLAWLQQQIAQLSL